MKTTISWMVIAAACLAGGCATRVEAYKSLSDFKQANAQADLVLIGNVTATKTLDRIMGDEIRSANLGVVGTDCITHETVMLKTLKVIKGTAPNGPIEIHYYEPCFHPSKGFKLVHQVQAIEKGDHVKVYLVNRDGQWWLIAHDVKNPPPGPAESIDLQIFSDDY